jgi:hypothetical protein
MSVSFFGFLGGDRTSAHLSASPWASITDRLPIFPKSNNIEKNILIHPADLCGVSKVSIHNRIAGID